MKEAMTILLQNILDIINLAEENRERYKNGNKLRQKDCSNNF